MSATPVPSPFLETLLSGESAHFDRSIDALSVGRDLNELLQDAEELEAFWSGSDNLYLRVRALIFLYHLHRFILPVEASNHPLVDAADLSPCPIPLDAHRALQARNFEEAIGLILREGRRARLNRTLSSGLATAYHALALQNLADQVRRSVRRETGNQWMFRIGHPDDYPLRFRPELLAGPGTWLIEQTPVRMDLSHSSWSDIFFLGMDRPEFAKVINVSIDLALRGSAHGPVPPCVSGLRVIDQPVVRLVSIDLECSAEISELSTLFDFGRDYLGLLKAALIASGLVPPGLEGSRTPLKRLLSRLVGPGKGVELVSWVRDIPKGSRLAVSTNLLGSLITTCMRATRQITNLAGELTEEERRLVASRAILGEWLGGSGGGWQDSGGVWPGVKLIEGCLGSGQIADPQRILCDLSKGPADWLPGDSGPDTGQSRGALLPRHRRLDGIFIEPEALEALENSLVLIHGGMAANVGPILEMVTERYLLRCEREWAARAESLDYTRRILEALRSGDMKELGRLTTEHFFGPLKTIIPWSSNAFTECMIEELKAELGEAFWGFWMLGGMSGGGMGLIVDPESREAAKVKITGILSRLKKEFERSLPFAMDPVLYDFSVNRAGTTGRVMTDREDDSAGTAFLQEYLRLQLPQLVQKHPSARNRSDHSDLQAVRRLADSHAHEFLATLVPHDLGGNGGSADPAGSLDSLLLEHGFDPKQHAQIRQDLLGGRVGLSQNRLHPKTHIEDVTREQIRLKYAPSDCLEAGRKALSSGRCAVVTLAAGAGTRWTQGAGVVKALHPFAPIRGTFRNFLEVHLAKSLRTARDSGKPVPHVITTGYLTHDPIADWLQRREARETGTGSLVPVQLSRGKSVGLRLVPTLRDLRYAWYELPQDKLDEQAEKMRQSVRQALMRWAESTGEGADYRDNTPLQCLHPVGHWYEVPNLLLNGTLHRLLNQEPNLDVLLLHNIDTLGASLDPVLLGHHLLSGAPLSFEVMERKFEDVGGGLARVNGTMRLVEGFALPREEDEFQLSFYNTATSWIGLDPFLSLLGVSREDLTGPDMLPGGNRHGELQAAIRELASRMPTYITLKETKKRWGRGQEDIFPVLQFERLWGDMSAYLPGQGRGEACFVEVDRLRGQQLKDPAQLDAWTRDGSLPWLEEQLDGVL